jgi:hypothetical protein
MCTVLLSLGVNPVAVNKYGNINISNTKQREKLNISNIQDCFITWETVKHGVLQLSVLVHYFFIRINDLLLNINHISNVTLFAGDTSVLVTDDSYDNFKQEVNLALPYLIK